MVNILERVSTALYTAGTTCMDTAVEVKKGVLWVGEESSLFMYDVYSLEGFEKFSKATISNLKYISFIPACKGVFDRCIGTLEAQKEIIYATLMFESSVQFIKKTVDQATGEVSYSFQVPRDRNNNVDVLKVLYGIGNPLDTLYFLQKYKVVSFPLASKISAHLGSLQLFSFGGEVYKYKDIPVLNCTVKKPKDLCVFIASVYQAAKCLELQGNDFWDKSNLCKFVGSIGKIVLISSADFLIKRKYYFLVATIDLITQDVGLIAMIIKRHQDRQKRFNHPA